MKTDTEEVVIDLSMREQRVRPKVLWQQLFDLYRSHGCPLDNMDNILIDYSNCEAVFAGDLPVTFYFGLDPGYYATAWKRGRAVEQPRLLACIFGLDLWWRVTVTTDLARFVPVRQEET